MIYGTLTQQLREMLPGESRKFTMNSVKECLVVKALCGRLNKVSRQQGIVLRTQLIRSYNIIKVYAHPI